MTREEQKVIDCAIELYNAQEAMRADQEDEPKGNRPYVSGTADWEGSKRFDKWLSGSRQKCKDRVSEAEYHLEEATKRLLKAKQPKTLAT
jgi:hypothetical protein